ncbi:hypothetical protein BLM37_02870 [Candidatus Gracilibacteria bacterium GN02-873]|nr:hypothetical protein BLM37_02870 [Candidatus Gracilibacteria bacterium GN02-873]
MFLEKFQKMCHKNILKNVNTKNEKTKKYLQKKGKYDLIHVIFFSLCEFLRKHSVYSGCLQYL